MLCSRVKENYAFLKSRIGRFPVRLMCKVLDIQHAGYYAWLVTPKCQRAKDNDYFSAFMKQFWLESGEVYGYRKIYYDRRAIGEQCGKNRVQRLMQLAKVQQIPATSGVSTITRERLQRVATKLLNREFTVDTPKQAWVTDIKHVKTAEGWLFVAIVLDLFSRQVIGWSMSVRINTELLLDALVMACWRRRPKQKVNVHSDQGCQL